MHTAGCAVTIVFDRVAACMQRLRACRAQAGRHMLRRGRCCLGNRMYGNCTRWFRRNGCHRMRMCMFVRNNINAIIHTYDEHVPYTDRSLCDQSARSAYVDR